MGEGVMGKAFFLLGAALAGAGLLAGCGGGGGGVGSTPAPPPAPPVVTLPTPTPTPTPVPAPTPTPTPTPSAINYDTPEYRATVGAVSMNALSVYQRGATGAGIAIGIIDSGIDLASAEFTGRVSAASAAVAGNDSIDDESGHGTAVAFTAAGRRNGAGTHGVAFDASVIVLRADRPGTCASTSTDDEESGCKFGTDAITRGVDVARAAGARVINISLGGSDMPANLRAAIGRATANGIVVVIAAGNDGTAEPDAFASVANDAAVARGQVIIAGSVSATDAISSFSDRAGSSAAAFLTAVGERVRAPDETDTAYLWSGTSFAAPQISGAAALLAQAFPNLSGAQIVEILLRTARDVGATGVDAVYGNGVVDLTRAFQPVGAVTVAGTGAPVSTVGNAVLSAPMGDATTSGLGAVILDGYDRAFAIDLARTIARTAPPPPLAGALAFGGRQVAVTTGGTAVAMTLAPGRGSTATLARTALTGSDARVARAIAATVTQRLGKNFSLAFGLAQSSTALAAQLAGERDPAFLIASAAGLGFQGGARSAGALRQQIGAFGITAGYESGRVLSRRETLLPGRSDYARSSFDRASLTLDRRFGPIATRLGLARLSERNTVLGAQFDTSLGAARATSWFVDTGARIEIGEGWSFGGSARQGWTTPVLRGGFAGDGSIRTSAFSADIGKEGLFGRDTAGLRIAQPLRVTSGGIDLSLPTYWDYAAGQVTSWTAQRLNLAPQGREIDVEARYAFSLGGGDLQTNLFWRRDPGNWATLPDDYGVALRYSVGL